jgi:hypothetical protein
MRFENVQRFSNEEARNKLNHRIRSRVEFAGVPSGTTGRVVSVFEISATEFDVVVQWDLADEDEPLRDRFAKNTYEALLFEEDNVPVAA